MPKPKATCRLWARVTSRTSGSLEGPGVTVGRRVQQEQLVALADLLAVELVVVRRRAAHVEHRRDPADELLHGRGGQELGIGRAGAAAVRAGGPARGSSSRSPCGWSPPHRRARGSSPRARAWSSQPSRWAHSEIRSSRGSARRSSIRLMVTSRPLLHDGASPGCVTCGGPSGDVWPASSMTCSTSSGPAPTARAGSRAGRRSSSPAAVRRSPRWPRTRRAARRASRISVTTCANVILVAPHRPGGEPAGDQVALRLVVRVVQVDHRPVGASGRGAGASREATSTGRRPARRP